MCCVRSLGFYPDLLDSVTSLCPSFLLVLSHLSAVLFRARSASWFLSRLALHCLDALFYLLSSPYHNLVNPSLSTHKDTISLPPSHFGLPPLVALEAEANKKYANRVVLDVGLAICVFDFVKVGEGVVHYGDGCYWYKGVSLRFYDGVGRREREGMKGKERARDEREGC